MSCAIFFWRVGLVFKRWPDVHYPVPFNSTPNWRISLCCFVCDRCSSSEPAMLFHNGRYLDSPPVSATFATPIGRESKGILVCDVRVKGQPQPISRRVATYCEPGAV